MNTTDTSTVSASCPIVQCARLRSPRWNAYVVGALMGVLSWIAFAVVDKPLGVSTAMSEVAGAAAMPVVGKQSVLDNPYWKKHMPAWNYGTLFLVGTFLGALVSSLLSRSFKIEAVPQVWQQRFGRNKLGRFVAAFVGGVIVMYGARMAGGCTSGHGISGSLQLALSSWTFFITMFVTGVATAMLMFGLKSKTA